MEVRTEQKAVVLVILVMMAGLLGGYEAQSKDLDETFFASQASGVTLIVVALREQVHILMSRGYNAFTRFWERPVVKIRVR